MTLERYTRKFVKAAGIVAVIGILAGAKATYAAEYPGLLRVESVNGSNVSGVDANGFTWQFCQDGNDYFTGDLCAVIYDDKGTKIIFDDEIVSARYVGTVEMY